MTPSPVRWAIDLSLLLNAVLGPDHFPIKVPELAREYSLKRYPDDPVSLVIGDNLPGFDGALIRAPRGNKGWGIFYNDAITSEGRINFTLAHEFGHYLITGWHTRTASAVASRMWSAGTAPTAR